MAVYVKRNLNAPKDFFACEAAGLQWLADVDDGALCVQVLDQDATSLTLQRLDRVRPDVGAAREFGRRLAGTHDAGAPSFGAAPDGWRGPGFFGPLSRPLPMALTGHTSWGRFLAEERLVPMIELARPRLDAGLCRRLDELTTQCRRGRFDDDDAPSRLHGDLWSGNVMWTRDGVILIDPAAHGGHRETDLAMLALFGCPFYDAVLDGYQDRHPLRPGWQQRIGLHQLYPLLAHVVLFGSGYLDATSAAVASALAVTP